MSRMIVAGPRIEEKNIRSWYIIYNIEIELFLLTVCFQLARRSSILAIVDGPHLRRWLKNS